MYVVNASRSFPHSLLITWFVTRITRLVPLVEQELLTLPEHISSITEFGGIRVTRSLFLCIMRCRSLCVPFPFGHCDVCYSIYRLWLPLWYLQTLFIHGECKYDQYLIGVLYAKITLKCMLFMQSFDDVYWRYTYIILCTLERCVLICPMYLYLQLSCNNKFQLFSLEMERTEKMALLLFPHWCISRTPLQIYKSWRLYECFSNMFETYF